MASYGLPFTCLFSLLQERETRCKAVAELNIHYILLFTNFYVNKLFQQANSKCDYLSCYNFGQLFLVQITM